MLSDLKQQFQIYTKPFYTNDPLFNRNILLKAQHSLRVANICADIASHEGFSPDDQIVAQAIGLLHDIGRFEQYRQFNTFVDQRSLNHGVLGASIIEQHFSLSGILETYQDMIIKTTRYHNCACLPLNENARTLAFLRVVRDADKIDIFDLSYRYFIQRTENNKNEALELHLDEGPQISEKIFQRVMTRQLAFKSDIKTVNDFKALQISWIFDLNFSRSFEIVEQRQALEKIYDTFPPGNDQAQQIYKKARAYLDQRTQDACRTISH